MNNALQDHRLKASIDAHQHFWSYDPVRHDWINEEMAVIRKDFMPEDLQPVLQENGIEGCVAVQADQTEAETDFLLQLASRHAFIKGVVGWIDLRAQNAEERMAHYASYNKLKGFRHVLQAEAPAFMLQPSFANGIGLLRKFHFTYDLLLYPQHLRAALELVRQFPEQPFVIDHIAKPFIKRGEVDEWKKDMAALGSMPNVHCKISGLVTEADMRNWQQAHFVPYLDAVMEIFGINRVMYGSDWPVCLAAGNYTSVLGIVKEYLASFSLNEQQLFFGRNATAFYHLI